MLQLWSCLCAHQVGWASVGSGSPREPGPALLAAVSWWLPVTDTIFPCSAAATQSFPAVLHRVVLKGGREPGQAAAATVSVSYPGSYRMQLLPGPSMGAVLGVWGLPSLWA